MADSKRFTEEPIKRGFEPDDKGYFAIPKDDDVVVKEKSMASLMDDIRDVAAKMDSNQS